MRHSVIRRAAAWLLVIRVCRGLSLQRGGEDEDPDDVPPACPHETCRISTQFQRHINETRGTVEGWEVQAARPHDTDRVAVTIFQPETPESALLFNYVIRANMHRLGAKWALLLFYGSEAGRKMLDEALGRPANVLWMPIKIEGTRRVNVSKPEANWFRLSMDFWGQVPRNLQHVLVFESDSLVLQGPGCVEDFFDYSYVGSPWNESARWGGRRAAPVGGNGGFSLRRLEDMVAAVGSEWNEKNLRWDCETKRKKWRKKHWDCPEGRPKHRFSQNEDGEMVNMLRAMADEGRLVSKRAFPSRELAYWFAVEQIFTPKPCGLHNPWEFLSEAQADQLLRTAQMS